MSDTNRPGPRTIPEDVLRARLAQSEQMREFFLQMWLENPALARCAGERVQALLRPLATVPPAPTFRRGSNEVAKTKFPRGFALPSAIFLLVILALLGAFMLNVSNTQHLTSAQDIQGVRAYRAARMGLEWAVAQLCGPAADCTAPLTDCPVIPASLSIQPDGFPVAVTCVRNVYNEAGPEGDIQRNVFWVTSTARSGGAVGGIGYVERSLNTLVEFPE